MSTTTSASAPIETSSPVIDFSRPELRGYNYIHLPRHPDQIVHLIDTMDLSRVVFQGEEHWVVKRETKRKVFGIIPFGTSAKEIDTGRSIPNIQRHSLWRWDNHRGAFPNAWENADPFCGSGDSATIDFLEAAVHGKLNLSEITEDQFRADLRARFLAHYTAQLARVRAYIPLVVELQEINTREWLEAFDAKMKKKPFSDMISSHGQSSLYTPNWATEQEHFQEVARSRVALLAERLPYTQQMLVSGLQTFWSKDTLSASEAAIAEFIDKNRYKDHGGNPTPGMPISRGETVKSAALMKQLTDSISFLGNPATQDIGDEARKARLQEAGVYLAYIDLLREGLDVGATEMAVLQELETKLRGTITVLSDDSQK